MGEEAVTFSPVPYRRTWKAVKFVTPLLMLVALWQVVVLAVGVNPRVLPDVPTVQRAGGSTVVDGSLWSRVAASM